MYNRRLELELSLEPCPWSLVRPQSERLAGWRLSSGRASIQSCEANETAAISAGLNAGLKSLCGWPFAVLLVTCERPQGVIARVTVFDSLQWLRYGVRVRHGWFVNTSTHSSHITISRRPHETSLKRAAGAS